MTLVPAALAEVAATAALTAAFVAASVLLSTRRLLTRLRVERDAAVHETARIGARCEALKEETQHLVFTRLPALVAHLNSQHVPVPELADLAFAGTEVERAHTAALEQVAQAVAAERLRVDEAAQAVMRGVTNVIQAQSYQLRSKIDTMQHRYEGPEMARDLLELDQLNEQNLRRLQAMGVPCRAGQGLTRSEETQAAWGALQAGTASGRAAAHPHRREGSSR
jgi:hypothetical protein